MTLPSLLVILGSWQPKQADIEEELREAVQYLTGESGANTMICSRKRSLETLFETEITTSERIYCDSPVSQVRKIRLLRLHAYCYNVLVPADAVYFCV
jgi:hypothetical protein